MPENPYKEILALIRRDSEQRTGSCWAKGIVRSVSPLTVEYAGYVLDRELLMDARLTEEIRLGRLTAGNEVAMLKDPDGGEFIVLCKVVKP